MIGWATGSGALASYGPTYGQLSVPRRRCVRKSAGSQQSDSSWRYPAFTINPDWTTFSVSKIPSITFFFPPNNASGPPACRLLKGRQVWRRQ